MAAADVINPPGDATQPNCLRNVLTDHRPELIRSLDSNTLFLTYLARHQIIEPADILTYEHYNERERRNIKLLDKVSERESLVDGCYSKFLDALKRSDQDHLAAMLTNVEKELEIANKYQTVLEGNLEDIHGYLRKESRRTELHYSSSSPEHKHHPANALGRPPGEYVSQDGVDDLLCKVQQSTKSTVVHLDRCREVIDKLHTDCDVVAKKNGAMLNKLRECDTLTRQAVPANVRKNIEEKKQERQETGSVASGISISTRSRHNEAEVLMDSVRYNVGAITDEKREREADDNESIQVVNNIMKDIKIRRIVLDRCCDSPPPDLIKDKYTQREPEDDVLPIKSKTKMKVTILDLAEEMQGYVHQETHMTHKQNLGKFHTSRMSHRNFDQIEHDMKHLDKEVRRGDHVRASTLLKQVSEATKVERQDCLRMVDDIGRVVRMRRLKLQELSTGNRPRRRAKTRRKTTRMLNTNFASKLSEVDRDVRIYMDMEIDLMAKHKEDMMKKKLEYDKELRFRIAEARNLDLKVRELDDEKDKYKKLYAQEKPIKETRMLTRPIIPQRVLPERAENDVRMELFYQRPLPSKSPSRSQQLGKYNKNSHHLSRSRDLSVGRIRGNRQANTSGSQHTRIVPIIAKPRLTPRAKQLTRLKATAKERHISNSTGSPVRNT